MEQEERLKAALADRYQIEREIGSGGMATVYLAQDLKHDRKVAVKVLKPELAAVMGTERFLAEIRTTANLTHPHILPLHDSGEADGFLFYVMPYVEGESLRAKLDRDGQLSVEEAVRVAGHVADALDHAHRQGVIHRDVKPSNILFEDDQPVVTDFGIALAVSAAGEGRLTETGLSLGTPYYMSPEQAAGDQTPTAASDVYSLGCVLYEMLTGEPPHTGASAQAILGKILLAEVTRPTKLRRTIPTNVEAAVLKALERLPADRFETVSELATALKDKAFRHGVGAGAASGGLWNWLSITSAVVAVLALVAALTGILTPRLPPPPAKRQEIQRFGMGVFEGWGAYTFLAPDGSSLVYPDTVGLAPDWQYWVKERGSLEPRPFVGTTRGLGVSYSPDGRWFAFVEDSALVKQPLEGAGQVTLLEGVKTGWMEPPGHWMADGTILLSQEGRTLLRIPEEGGAPPDTVFVFSEDFTFWIRALPGEEAALVGRCPTRPCTGDAYLSVVDLRADTTWVLLDEAVRAWYAPTGHLVWVRSDGAVFATPFELARLRLSDTHELLIEDVSIWSAERVFCLMGQDGTVLYVQRATSAANQLIWVDRAGRAEPLDAFWESGSPFSPALSPNGRFLAVSVTTRSGQEGHIWVKELPGGPGMRLTTGEGWRIEPTWAPDGNTIVYGTNEALLGAGYDLGAMLSDGRSGATGQVLLDLERSIVEPDYTPDAQGIVFRVGSDIGYLDLTTGDAIEDFLATEATEKEVSLSPDGRWMAYTSDRTGRFEVYVSPFPDVNSRTFRVSSGGGRYPLWARNGRELFYRGGDRWVTAVTYSADSVFTVEDRERLFDPGFSESMTWKDWDITPSGDRFIMVRPPPPGSARFIEILNFFTELGERFGR